MSVIASIDPRPGRPRVIDSRSWFVDHGDGRVSYCTIRRVEGGAPNGLVLGFEAASEAAALALFDRYREEQGVRVERNAERRGKWGPEGKGMMK